MRPRASSALVRRLVAPLPSSPSSLALLVVPLPLCHWVLQSEVRGLHARVHLRELRPSMTVRGSNSSCAIDLLKSKVGLPKPTLLAHDPLDGALSLSIKLRGRSTCSRAVTLERRRVLARAAARTRRRRPHGPLSGSPHSLALDLLSLELSTRSSTVQAIVSIAESVLLKVRY